MENVLQNQIGTVLAAEDGLRNLSIDEILTQLPPAAHNLNQVNIVEITVSEDFFYLQVSIRIYF